MNKHTPGTWAVSKHGTPAYAPQFGVYAEGANDHVIVRGENAEADAALIAQAPDLLEALRQAERALSGWPNWSSDAIADATRIARAAIRKAEA